MAIKIILTILVSAIIGYITNLIAIKMLFHPYKEHKLFGKIHIPFTPGIIPKNRYRMAKAIAETLGSDILRKDVIIHELNANLNVTDLISEYNSDDVKNMLEGTYGKKEYDEALDKVASSLTKYILNEFRKREYAKAISSSIYQNFATKLGFLSAMLGSVDELIEDKINEYVDQNGDEKLSKIIRAEVDKALENKLGDILKKGDNFGEKILISAIDSVSAKLLEKIDFKGVIENELNNLDIKSFEKMLLKVISKELKAITYFGGLLGALLGAINVLLLFLPNI